MGPERVELTFRPLGSSTQAALRFAYFQSGGDPMRAYESMLPAVMILASISGLQPVEIALDVYKGRAVVDEAIEVMLKSLAHQEDEPAQGAR